MNINSVYRIFLTFFRSKRMKKFVQHFEVNEGTHRLDVAGSLFNWKLMSQNPQLIILMRCIENQAHFVRECARIGTHY